MSAYSSNIPEPPLDPDEYVLNWESDPDERWAPRETGHGHEDMGGEA